jgi:hypothetical protein
MPKYILPRTVGPAKNNRRESVSDDNKNETPETPANKDAAVEPAPKQQEQASTQDGPNFTKGPDPLAGLRKNTADVMAGMEGKTVSMKFYVGSIIGVIVLMLLARCGG